jgi:hypothetical protein
VVLFAVFSCFAIVSFLCVFSKFIGFSRMSTAAGGAGAMVGQGGPYGAEAKRLPGGRLTNILQRSLAPFARRLFVRIHAYWFSKGFGGRFLGS